MVTVDNKTIADMGPSARGPLIDDSLSAHDSRITSIALEKIKSALNPNDILDVNSLQVELSRASVKFSYKMNDEVKEQSFTPKDQIFIDIMKVAVSSAKEKVIEAQKAHEASPLISACLDKVIPASDKLAIHRNIARLAISAASVVIIALGIAGVANPLILFGITLALSLVAVGGFFALYKSGKISKRDFLILSAMTLSCSISSLTGGNYVLLAGYSFAVLVQAILFAIPQGALGWGKGGWNSYQIARAAGNTNVLSPAVQMNSGVTSFLEGSTWVVMASLMIYNALSNILGLPACPSEILSWVVTVLYLGIFNVNYSLMIASGVRGYLIQNKFHDGIVKAFNEGKTPLNALKFIRDKMVPKDSLRVNIEPLDQKEKRLMKKQHRLSERMDADSFELIDIELIDQLMVRLEDEKFKTEAEEIARCLVSDIISSNNRKRDVCRSTIMIGLAGLLVGSALSLLEEFTNSGSVIHMPYMGDVLHLSGALKAAMPEVSTMVDCAFWALMNYLFLTKLDLPPGRTEEESKILSQLKLYKTERKWPGLNNPSRPIEEPVDDQPVESVDFYRAFSQ